MLAAYKDRLTMGPLMEKALTNANPTERLATLINQFFVLFNVLYFCTFLQYVF